MSNLSPEAKAFYKPRIGDMHMLFIYISYGIVYGLQIILNVTVLLSVVAAFIGVVASSVLALDFYMCGVYKSKSNFAYILLITLAGFIVEIFPELDLAPADLIEIAALTGISRSEDRKTAEDKAKAAAKAANKSQEKARRIREDMQKRQRRAAMTATSNYGDEDQYQEAA